MSDPAPSILFENERRTLEEYNLGENLNRAKENLMCMVVGTNGCGKSTLARKVLDSFGAIPSTILSPRSSSRKYVKGRRSSMSLYLDSDPDTFNTAIQEMRDTLPPIPEEPERGAEKKTTRILVMEDWRSDQTFKDMVYNWLHADGRAQTGLMVIAIASDLTEIPQWYRDVASVSFFCNIFPPEDIIVAFNSQSLFRDYDSFRDALKIITRTRGRFMVIDQNPPPSEGTYVGPRVFYVDTKKKTQPSHIKI